MDKAKRIVRWASLLVFVLTLLPRSAWPTTGAHRAATLADRERQVAGNSGGSDRRHEPGRSIQAVTHLLRGREPVRFVPLRVRDRVATARRAMSMVTHYRNWPTAYRQRLGRPADRPVLYRLRDGTSLSLHPGDVSVRLVNEIWLDRVYEPNDMVVVQPGWVVLDVGANQGIYSVRAARIGGATQVHAVEPESSNLERLHENARLNNLTNITIHPEAVSCRTGMAMLHLDSCGLSGGHSRDTRAFGLPTVAVSTIRLDDLVASIDGPIDVLKMDIEGAEYDVLACASDATYAGIRRVVMECHAIGGYTAAGGAARLHDLLASKGFVCAVDDSPQGSILVAYRAALK